MDEKDSKFNMWRATMIMAHVDGEVSPEEEEWITSIIQNLPIENTFKETLMSDLKSPPKLSDVLNNIDHKPDRAMLLHYARIIFHKDGNFDGKEKEIFQKVHDFIMQEIDLDAIQSDLDSFDQSLKEDETKGSISYKIIKKLF